MIPFPFFRDVVELLSLEAMQNCTLKVITQSLLGTTPAGQTPAGNFEPSSPTTTLPSSSMIGSYIRSGLNPVALCPEDRLIKGSIIAPSRTSIGGTKRFSRKVYFPPSAMAEPLYGPCTYRLPNTRGAYNGARSTSDIT